MREKLEKVYCGKLTFFINNTRCIINTYNLYMSNLMIKYVAQREIYSFGKKHDWKNLHFKGPCEWWLPIFLVQKPSLFFLQQQKIGLQIENRVYKYITKYWGKNRRLTQMCFSSAGAFKVIYHICFAIPAKKYRSPFRYIYIHTAVTVS